MFFLPTYNRPQRLREVLLSMPPCTEVGIIWVQGDDCTKDYEKVIKDCAPKHWKAIFCDKNIGLCQSMNEIFRLYPNERCYGLICDDEFVHTPRWDTTLSDAADRWNFAHGNEGWQSERRIHSYVTVGGDMVRACGWWALPGLWHWFHDDVQEKIANTLGVRKYCKDVKTEHKHYLAGKAVKDTAYTVGESRGAQDQHVYLEWLKTADDFIASLRTNHIESQAASNTQPHHPK